MGLFRDLDRFLDGLYNCGNGNFTPVASELDKLVNPNTETLTGGLEPGVEVLSALAINETDL